MRNAILYTNALHELHLKAQPMIFVDCVRPLSKFPISKILLNDGFHLSSKTSNALDQSTGRYAPLATPARTGSLRPSLSADLLN